MSGLDLKAPSCAGCIATRGLSSGNGQRPAVVYQPGHEMADRSGFVYLCFVLREQGACQLEIGQRWAAAMHDLAAAIRESEVLSSNDLWQQERPSRLTG